MADGPRVKICGVMRREDALAVERAGASYMGVILSAGFSRSVEPADGARLVEGITPIPVAVLVEPDARAAETAARAIGAGVFQLHGEEPPSVLAQTDNFVRSTLLGSVPKLGAVLRMVSAT